MRLKTVDIEFAYIHFHDRPAANCKSKEATSLAQSLNLTKRAFINRAAVFSDGPEKR